MAWRNWVIRARYRHVQRFVAETSRSFATQRQVLFDKLRRNADSDLGRRFGFAKIRSLADFRRLPISSYEDYRPYVDRVKQGETSAMFAPGTRVLMFSMTSGTSGQAKYIPITREFVAEYRKGWNLWGSAVFWDHRPLLQLWSVQLTSDWRKFHTDGGIPCGSISGLASEMSPLVSRVVFLDTRPLMKMSDPLAKHYVSLRLSLLKRNIGSLITANPSTLVEMAKIADRDREVLIRDIYEGTLSDKYHVPDGVRRALRWRLRPNRDRARELEQIVERTGHLLPRDYWPELKLLSVWTGGSVGAYLPPLREVYGDLPVRDHGLSASEGRMTIPLEDNTSAGVLDYTSQYFEFIPEEEHGRPNPIVLEAHELEIGKRYFVVLTTSSGFYRYDIFDLVECTGYQGQAPLLKFLNKGSHFSSITGEKLSEYQVADSVKRAMEEMGMSLGLFTMAPHWDDPPGYELLLEPGPYMHRHKELAARVDRHIGRMNIEYRERLESQRLRPLAVRAVPEGAWEVFRANRLRRGGSLEQYKHPCLTNDLEFVRRLESMVKEASGAALVRRQAEFAFASEALSAR
jgi:hypothetical protein